ncbi:GumC family protein [Albidovulum sediminicola]|uniref:Wzz/FepE/Etk N-terminal domain-containing protein n=1 Tax=Albidovulum sediminicola TaxID=2984331 RepID=A0ABT2YWQ2_9RHOB|nr:Wzz/FepE/Etk N-terminal domain-containing protein [Defluviimonas sp. WL0075]MCV2863307.1 Wzz/FepE/Etk N-terminal domain-containing protein [Defluviimonas sp. WL0075]
MNLDLAFYFAVFRRRLPYFLATVIVITAAALAVAIVLPPQYESEAKLLLESSQIPDAMAAPTVQSASLEKLQVLEQRLMTRENLLQIARAREVFKDIEEMTPNQIVGAMIRQTDISIRGGQQQATLMLINFTARSSEVASAVVSDYVELVLSADVDVRVEAAKDTLDFFQQETTRLSGLLSQLSAEILQYQNANADALPDTLQFRMTQLAQLQERLAASEREIELSSDQKGRLNAIFDAAVSAGIGALPQTDEARQLSLLRDQLAQARIIYSESNPRVRILEEKVKVLEDTVRRQTETGASDAGPSGATTTLKFQIADIETKLTQLETQKQELSKQIEALKDTIDRTPEVKIGLDGLEREYANIQQQYNTAVANLASASTGERIEVLSKGARVSLLEPATRPDGPSKPKRRRIALMGLVGGIGAGLGLVLLIELLNRSVRRPKDLIDSFGIMPIATIPYMQTPGEIQARRTIIAMTLVIVGIGLPGAVYAIHTYYMPLDQILANIAARLGVRL